MKWLKRLLILGIFGLLCGVSGAFALYFYFAPDLPDVSSLKEVQLQTPMRVFSREGELISQFGEKRRIPLKIDAIPEQMIQAVLATEDNRFYEHPGIDLIGITRAVVNLISTGEKSQGASTITQQVARNFFLSPEKTYTRKIKEIFLALKIERQLSKDQILELYLNKIPLGYRSFGVGAAAQVYYGKTVDELTLAQIAVIAGLPKAPSALNPIRSPKRATERRRVVLGRMLSTGYITQAQFDEADQSPITARYHGAEITLAAPYLAEMVRQEMLARYGEEAYSNGMDVYTTVSAKQQSSATQALRANLLAYDQRHGYRGAIAKLWKKDEPMLTAEAIHKALASYPNYGPLIAAVVHNVNDDGASITLKDQMQGQIAWEQMHWARRFINDERQGPAPKKPRDVLSAGDVIWVEQLESEGQYRLSQLPDAGAALVAISPKDGAIQSLVGGFSFNQSKFNRVTQASRQVGSNIKPFLYSAALESGMTLATLINDAPINQWDEAMGVAWRPRNSPPVYDGPMRLRKALAQSKNVVSVRLIRELGVPAVINHLARFGFPANDLPRNDTLALGSASLTPMQVASAYASFTNGGYLVTPYFIEKVVDNSGEVIFQAAPPIACDDCGELEHRRAPKIISSANAFLISQALNSAIFGGGSWANKTHWNGTGWRAARELKRTDIAGKTGTTNDAKDAWFSGFSPDLVATSWLGFDDFNRSLGRTSANSNLGQGQTTGSEFGAKTAQPAWIDVMETALADIPVSGWPVPAGVSTIRIDLADGSRTQRSDHGTRFEYFAQGTEPPAPTQNNEGSIYEHSEVEELF